MPSLSIGARFTLRFTLALLVTVSLFAGLLYNQLVQQVESAARSFLVVQVRDLAELVERDGLLAPSVARALERSVLVAESDYKLGLQVFDARGRTVAAGGTLARHPLPPSPAPPPLRPGAPPAEEVFRQVDLGESYPYLVVSAGAGEGSVQGALYTRRFVRNARDLRNLFLYTAPVMLLVTAAIGYWLARGSLRPIQQVTATARRISGTNLEETLPTRGTGDELDELAATLNDMMDRIRAGMARTRRFAANAAHELRTPLNRMRGRLEVSLEKERSAEEYRGLLEEVAVEVEGLSESLHGLLRLAQSEAGIAPGQRTDVDLRGLLEDVVSFFEPLADERGVVLEHTLEGAGRVSGDASWLHQLFANLVHNALKYSDAEARVAVVCMAEPGRVAIEVRDEGVGIPADEAERIFEPFHRVRSQPGAPGVGLGLPLAREIARAHGGDIHLASEPGRGSVFRVDLPRAPEV